METKNKQRIVVSPEVNDWLQMQFMNIYAEGYRECWDEFTYYREDNWPENEWEIRPTLMNKDEDWKKLEDYVKDCFDGSGVFNEEAFEIMKKNWDIRYKGE